MKLPCVGASIELAVVIPTYNERENVAPLLTALEIALAGIEWEAVFVDDSSPDGTAEYTRRVAATDRRVRVLERIGRRGLSSACIEGMLATPARYIAVMDADLQHDESILPRMLEKVKSGNLDIVIATRKIVGGSMGQTSRQRTRLSDRGAQVSRLICRCDVSDPMSGFFLVDSRFFRRSLPYTTGTGFKILVDLLASSPRPVQIAEVPYHFRNRERGESKLDIKAELEYVYLIVDKLVGKVLPTQFVLFGLVGSLGLIVHVGVLAALYYSAQVSFTLSQVMATACAMTFNFLLNNLVTFRDRRLRGWRIASGLITFYIACSLGALVNVSFAQFLLHYRIPWYLAGISGMAISAVWNYGVNTILTWRRERVRSYEAKVCFESAPSVGSRPST